MSNTGIVMIVVLGLSFVILIVLMAVIFRTKEKEVPQKKAEKALTIEDLVRVASDRNSSKDSLTRAVLEVSKSFPFPPKNGNNAPKEAQSYLDFVFFTVYNKNSDAKLIAYLSQEMKKKNPAYVKEIDAYEEEAMKKRRFQPQK